MKLNLGCGNDYRDGWINLDSGDCRCDVHHDIENVPWPFDDGTFFEVHMQHVLEHVRREMFFYVIEEIYRVSAPGGLVVVRSPHALSDNQWTDPTHKLGITTRTFDYFDPDRPLSENGRLYGWADVRLSVKVASLIDNPPNGPDVHIEVEVVK